MPTKRIINMCTLIIVTVLMLTVTPVQAQIIYGQATSTNIEMIYSHWSVEGDGSTGEINQLSFPLGGFIPLKDNFEARFYIGNAVNTMSVNDIESKLSGLSDLRIQFNHSFLGDRYLLSAGLNLPTGRKKLDITDEKQVLEFLSENYLTFPIRRLGEGLGFNLMAGGATMVGKIRGGLSALYQYNGSYKPYDNEGDYDPGDFFSITASADRQTEKSAYVINIIFTSYVSDKFNDLKVFKQSNNLDLRFSGLYRMQSIDLNGSARYLIRGRNTRYDAPGEEIVSQLKSFGNEFSLYGKAVYRPTDDWYMAPLLEMKIIDANEVGMESSSVYGFGAAFGKKLTETVDLDAGFKYFTGSADEDNLDISGFQINTSLIAAF